MEVAGVNGALGTEDVPYIVVRQGGEELCRADARLDSSAIHLSTALRAPLLVPPSGSGAALRLPEADDPADRPLELELWRCADARGCSPDVCGDSPDACGYSSDARGWHTSWVHVVIAWMHAVAAYPDGVHAVAGARTRSRTR